MNQKICWFYTRKKGIDDAKIKFEGLLSEWRLA